MKTKLGIVVVTFVTVFVSGCGSSPQSLIIGKWEAGESGAKLTAEFTTGGQAKLTMLGNTIQGAYKLNGDELEWTLGGKTTKMKVNVTATNMEVTSDGKTIKYKRV